MTQDIDYQSETHHQVDLEAEIQALQDRIAELLKVPQWYDHG